MYNYNRMPLIHETSTPQHQVLINQSYLKRMDTDIKELKNHMRYAMTALVGGMFTIIIILFEKL